LSSGCVSCIHHLATCKGSCSGVSTLSSSFVSASRSWNRYTHSIYTMRRRRALDPLKPSVPAGRLCRATSLPSNTCFASWRTQQSIIACTCVYVVREGTTNKQANLCAGADTTFWSTATGHLAPEVNCSPTFEHSTPVTARMVREPLLTSSVTVDVADQRDLMRRSGTFSSFKQRAPPVARPTTDAADLNTPAHDSSPAHDSPSAHKQESAGRDTRRGVYARRKGRRKRDGCASRVWQVSHRRLWLHLRMRGGSSTRRTSSRSPCRKGWRSSSPGRRARMFRRTESPSRRSSPLRRHARRGAPAPNPPPGCEVPLQHTRTVTRARSVSQAVRLRAQRDVRRTGDTSALRAFPPAVPMPRFVRVMNLG
jgi:hypothetical protein